MADIQTQLKLVGLNNSEITVYLFLLENGQSTPPIVSRGTFIARTNCYNILEALQEKGLIAEIEDGVRKAYVATDPESLIRSLEQKKEAVRQILPDLHGLYTLQKNKPRVRFFENPIDIQNVYLQSLEAPTISLIRSEGDLNSIFPGFEDYFRAELLKKSSVFREINNHGSSKNAPGKNEFVKSVIGAEATTTDILIWNNTVALITLGPQPCATVLTNNPLHATFAALFNTLSLNTQP